MAKLRMAKAPRSSSWLKFSEALDATETVYDQFDQDQKTARTIRYYDVFPAPTLETSENDIAYPVQSSDRLDKLALRFYRNSSLWWVIALRNGLDLPVMNLDAVDRIIIPDPGYVLTTFG